MAIASLEETQPFPQANLDNPKVMQILQAAAECFAHAGYEAASTKEIARRAGVSKSLLHYHFQSKEHILVELQSLMFRTAAEQTRRISLEGTPSAETGLAALDALWELLKRSEHYIPVAVDLWRRAASLPALEATQRARMHEAYELIVLGIHQSLGPAVRDLAIPPERLAQLLFTTLPGFVVRYRTSPDEAEQAFEDFKQLLSALLPADSQGQ